MNGKLIKWMHGVILQPKSMQYQAHSLHKHLPILIDLNHKQHHIPTDSTEREKTAQFSLFADMHHTTLSKNSIQRNLNHSNCPHINHFWIL